MSFNHSVSDLVTIIRNGSLAKKDIIHSQASKLRESILQILKDEGYIISYTKVTNNDGVDVLNIHLKYHASNPVIKNIEVISKPGKRIYCDVNSIPVIKNGLGTVLLSTSKGVLPDHLARSMMVGGEILLKIF